MGGRRARGGVVVEGGDYALASKYSIGGEIPLLEEFRVGDSGEILERFWGDSGCELGWESGSESPSTLNYPILIIRSKRGCARFSAVCKCMYLSVCLVVL